MSANILQSSISDLYKLVPEPADEMVDLACLFGGSSKPVFERGYLESFQEIAVFWDSAAKSDQLRLGIDEYDARIITSKSSIHSFKTVYS